MQNATIFEEKKDVFLQRGVLTHRFQYADIHYEDTEFLFSQLSVRERWRLSTIIEQKRVEWMLGRIVAKRSIRAYFAQYVGLCPPLSSIDILSGNGQRPTYTIHNYEQHTSHTGNISNNDTILSISHCKGVAVAHVVNKHIHGFVGVDIERIRSFRDETIRAFLTAEEYVSHRKINKLKKEKDATLRWCLKEAYLKAKGTGLRTHPATIEVVWNEDFSKISFFEAGIFVPTETYWTTTDNLYILVSVTICV